MYPWPSFGEFMFATTERAFMESDQGWKRQPSIARARALGSTTDTILAMAAGSYERNFELLFSPSRRDEFAALLNTTASFTDWRRPVPDSRSAFLASIEEGDSVAVRCSDGTTDERIRVTVNLISQ